MSNPSVSTLQLPPLAYVGKVEECISSWYKLKDDDPECIILDLSDCSYIEITSLMTLISLILQRKNNKKRTLLRLPAEASGKRVRDFFRAWEFPRVVRDATGIPFSELVVIGDQRYFGENKVAKDFSFRGVLESSDIGIQRLHSENYFSFTSFFPARITAKKDIVYNQSAKWNEYWVQGVLSNHLTGDSGYLASRIIFESLYNAFRHSRANIVLTASRFDKNVTSLNPDAPQYFTMVFWDDGDSMVDTLKNSLADDRGGQAIKDIVAKYHYNVENPESVVERSVLVSSDAFVFSSETPDEEMLLGTTLPGVTSDIFGQNQIASPDLDKTPELARPGMGLFILTNAVVDLFGGEVSFRTKNLSMKIKKSKKEDANYKVTIHRFGKWMPHFLGNMVTIRLPFKKSDEK